MSRSGPAKELSGHERALAERQRVRDETMTAVVDAHVVQSGALTSTVLGHSGQRSKNRLAGASEARRSRPETSAGVSGSQSIWTGVAKSSAAYTRSRRRRNYSLVRRESAKGRAATADQRTSAGEAELAANFCGWRAKGAVWRTAAVPRHAQILLDKILHSALANARIGRLYADLRSQGSASILLPASSCRRVPEKRSLK